MKSFREQYTGWPTELPVQHLFAGKLFLSPCYSGWCLIWFCNSGYIAQGEQYFILFTDLKNWDSEEKTHYLHKLGNDIRISVDILQPLRSSPITCEENEA